MICDKDSGQLWNCC